MQGLDPYAAPFYGSAPIGTAPFQPGIEAVTPVVLAEDPAVFERHEAEYEWFRYSKYALPALLFILACAAVLFVLTIWQAQITLKSLRDGTPRRYLLATPNDDTEAGLSQSARDLRLWGTCIIIITAILTLLVMYLKPPSGARKGAFAVLSLLLIVGGILTIIAMGIDAGQAFNGRRCRVREQGNVIRKDPCEDLDEMVSATSAGGLMTGVFAIATAVVLVVAAMKSGKGNTQGEFDAPYAVPRYSGVSKATKNLAIILLLLTLAFAIILLVFTVFLTEQRDFMYMDEVYGIRRFTNPESGWSSRNSRLRIATSSTIIFVVLLALIPFRSRVVAYLIAFILFLTTVMCFICFSFDVREVQNVKALPCPDLYECTTDMYIAVIFFDIFTGFVVLLYVIFEYVFRLAMNATHLTRM